MGIALEESFWACGETRLGSGRGLNRAEYWESPAASKFFFFKKKRLKEVFGHGAGTL